MNLEIRQAKKEDLPEILSLLEKLSGTESDQKKALKSFDQILKSEVYFTFVAVSDGKIAGTASICLLFSLQRGRPWGLVDNVVVGENYRQKGVGKKLIEAIVEFAKGKDCYKIVLTARFSRTGAHRFWQRIGFKKHGFSFRMDL